MLSATRLLAVARKEVLQIRRDSRSLALAFVLPVVLLVLFGYAITWDVTDIRTLVVDQDRSSSSRALLDAFRSSRYFRVLGELGRTGEIGLRLTKGEAQLVLVVPPDFASELGAGRPAKLQAVLDGGDANTATIALAYTQGVVESWAAGREGRVAPPVSVESRVLYNENLVSRNMIVPGLVAVIMMIIAAMLTSLTLAREWERGTMEQLAATPVSRAEVVLGKLLPYLAIGFVDVALTSALGVFLFGVPLRGSVLLLAVLSLLFLVGGLGLGIFLSAVARTQLVATQLAMVATFLPAFLLSGFMFDISIMPRALQAVTYLVPARYFVVVTRAIFLKGVGVEVLWPQGLLMVAFAAAGVVLAIRSFKKEIPE